jgi:hypothetical protein
MSPLVITRWPAPAHFRPKGASQRMTWRELAQMLARPAQCPPDVDDPELPGWAPVELRDDYREKENVIAVHALSLDFDKFAPSVDRILGACGRRRMLVHSTRRYLPGAPRFRAVLAVSRPMTGSEYEPVWHYVSVRLASRALVVDGAPKDGSRFWYVPSEPREAVYVFRSVDGPPLDVDAVLAAATKERLQLAAARRSELAAAAGRGARYAHAALRRECEELATTGKGMRNDRLNRAAFALQRFVAAGDLTELEVRTALASVATLAGLTGAEVPRTIASGFRGRAQS